MQIRPEYQTGKFPRFEEITKDYVTLSDDKAFKKEHCYVGKSDSYEMSCIEEEE